MMNLLTNLMISKPLNLFKWQFCKKFNLILSLKNDLQVVFSFLFESRNKNLKKIIPIPKIELQNKVNNNRWIKLIPSSESENKNNNNTNKKDE